MSKTVEEHGWTAVPRSMEKLVAGAKSPKSSTPVKVEDIHVPDSPIVQSVIKYARENLSRQTFNHSMRVFCYGECNRFLCRHYTPFVIALHLRLIADSIRPGDHATALSRLALQPGNIPPRLPPARHRHHIPKSAENTTLLRVLRRHASARPAAPAQFASVAV